MSAPPRSEVSPATWKTRVTPRSARRTDARSSTSARTCSTSSPSSCSTREPARTVTRTRSPRSTRSRVTCEPTRPVAPVTRVTDTAEQGTTPSACVAGAPEPIRSGQCPPRPSPSSPTPPTTSRASSSASRGIHVVSLYVNQGGVDHEGVGHARLRGLLRRAADLGRPAHDLAAVDRRLHRGLRAAGRRGARHRLDPHLGRPVRARSSPRARPRPSSGAQRRIEVVDSQSTCGGLAVVVLAAQAAADAGADVEQVAAARPRRDRRARRSGSRSTRSSSCSAAGGSGAPRPGSAAR